MRFLKGLCLDFYLFSGFGGLIGVLEGVVFLSCGFMGLVVLDSLRQYSNYRKGV